MKQLTVIFCYILTFVSLTGGELVELSSKDGRTMQASIDGYRPDEKEVAVRVNGTGSVIRFSTDLLDAASVKKVQDWYRSYAVARLLRFDIERVPGDGDTCYYTIEISNPTNAPIAGLRAEYLIPVKERHQVVKKQPQNSGGKGKNKNKNKNKNQKVQYDTVETRSVKSGKIDLSNIPARGELVVESERIVIETTQTAASTGSQGRGKGNQNQGANKPLRNRHSVEGILLKIYSGNSLLQEVESKHGLSQMIERYRGG
ncbi:hypothetical protein SH580_18770 [Coraliomargarita algicola]|uniref:Uncharacterized protein n=1 Tax=Coraliomargarita algicola TaxID=3092156 RepID=A0ABZ0RJW2_9BACT|nr:hypothetical protein [Coraliomargarita sp. J2-16]WPJ95466.1 hypothetical protein SH580_18770 [Coraliomargarita sp. J2-16]